MKFRYALELLTVIALITFCMIFLYMGSVLKGSEFAGSDNAGSGLIAELSGIPQENFTPLIPQWQPPGREIESCLFALQAAIGGIFVGGVFGFWIGSQKKP
jgi:cobalt/nickel transport protein